MSLKFFQGSIPWTTFISKMFQAYMEKHYTMLPGVIKKYENGKAEVKPSVPIMYKGEWTKLPIITNVIIKRAGSSKANAVFPIDVGNEPVMLFFSMSSLDSWATDNTLDAIPVMNRKFHMNDAVGMLGFFPFSFDTFTPENDTDFFFEFEDIKVTLRKNNEIYITNGEGSFECGSDGTWDFNNGNLTVEK